MTAYNKYQNGKIYKLICNQTGQVYIGSTIKTIRERVKTHKYCYDDYKKGKSNYITSYPIIERNDYRVELIESFPCDSKLELEQREGYWIRHTICVNDSFKSGITVPCNHNKKEYNRQYKTIYKERLKEFSGRKFDCPCGGKYTHGHKPRHMKSIIHTKWIIEAHNQFNHL